MRIGLLQCDSLDSPVAAVAGDYPALIGHVLGAGARTVVFRADEGELPGAPAECDAWVVSGSRRSVYEPIGWIDALGRFVDRVLAAETPLVGLCFGHQVVASRLGAAVAHVGWRLGVDRYDVVAAGPAAGTWGQDEVALCAVHQDQVTELPDGAELVVTSSGCPVAGFTLGAHVLTMQPHPEFTTDVVRAIIADNPGRFGPVAADAAIRSLASITPDGRVAATVIRAALGLADPADRS